VQAVSGLNRQARQEDILNDPKNRLVASYMGVIEHLQPPYLLIEQVRRSQLCIVTVHLVVTVHLIEQASSQ
jgi:hypothetical protein